MAVSLLVTLTSNSGWKKYGQTKHCKCLSLQSLMEAESKVREKVFQVLLHEVTGRKHPRLVTSMGCA